VAKVGIKIFSFSLANCFFAAFSICIGKVQWEKIALDNVYSLASIAIFILILFMAIDNLDYIINYQIYGGD
jgi:hypothetical protein